MTQDNPSARQNSSGLIVRNLVKGFGSPPVRILHGLSLTLESGEYVSITGRSGSGKSTLLYCVSALDTLDSGEVTIDGVDLHNMTPTEADSFRNRSLGFVFQFHYLLPELTALENITLPARRNNRHEELKGAAVKLMERFDISHCRDKTPGKMSGGEQQRVAIARALLMKPSWLFADEPTGDLDSISGNKVMDIFDEINREDGTSILMVTHDEEYAARAGRRINLVDGRIESDSGI